LVVALIQQSQCLRDSPWGHRICNGALAVEAEFFARALGIFRSRAELLNLILDLDEGAAER